MREPTTSAEAAAESGRRFTGQSWNLDGGMAEPTPGNAEVGSSSDSLAQGEIEERYRQLVEISADAIDLSRTPDPRQQETLLGLLRGIDNP